MLPSPRTYSLVPSVVPADKSSLMTILSNERAFIFEDGDEYQLKIISVNADDSYWNIKTHRMITVTANMGVFEFEIMFEGEQEHTLILMKDEKTIATFSAFSLLPDLYSRIPLRGDLHSHSCRSDGTRDPSSQFGHFREMGYDFVALTDHNRYYPGGEIDETFKGVNTGITRILGEEVHTPESVVHIVHVGGKKSVTDEYVHRRENYEKQIKEYINRVPESIPEKYKVRYGAAMWATDAIHSAGGIAIFPHPFWIPGASKIYNVCDELAKILLTSGMFDAYELIGGMSQSENNRSIAFWANLRAEGLKIPVVGSSDVHNLEDTLHFPGVFTICFANKKDNDSIIEAVKGGYSVATELCGKDRERQYRCYGDFRLVTYAQFLLKNYFPRLERITSGAGVAMRAYAMEVADASAIETQTAIAECFTETFFGKRAPKKPSKKILEFEDKWRAVHKAGPTTKGASLGAYPGKTT